MNDSPYTSSPATVGYDEERPRMAFFTDTTVCIGCKACEVACKEWNDVPSTPLELTGFSYDNTGGLGSESWRAVKFVEQRLPEIRRQGADGAFVSAGQQGPDLSAVGTGGFAGDPQELDLTRADADGIALAVDELLRSPTIETVRECERCSWLFLSGGRGRPRRWCSMATCGNREKAARHYARRKAT